jgi:hypothetical protein
MRQQGQHLAGYQAFQSAGDTPGAMQWVQNGALRCVLGYGCSATLAVYCIACVLVYA